MQGTNAYALLCAVEEGEPAGVKHQQPLPWMRQRFWYSPAPAAMLHSGGVSAHAGSTTMVFQTALSRC
jgi:hypothetical protein